MKNNDRKLIVLTIFSLLFIACRNSEKIREIQLKSEIENYLDQLGTAGFYGSVLVAINDQPMIQKGYGYSDVAGKIENTPKTIFDIGSVTKQFTAAAILKLEMQGKLNTQDSITLYFTNVPADKRSITLHDLLRHQSGLISVVGKDYDSITKEAFLNKVFTSDLLFAPGSAFAYSNVGYSLLAMIIEQVSHQTYEEYLYQNLWKPAHMEMTGYSRPQYDANAVAICYADGNEVWGKPTDKPWDISAPYWQLKGNGGILSTAEDLFKWDQCLYSDSVLSNDAKEKLFHPQLRPGETENSYYGYGWDIYKTTRNTTRTWHNGTNRISYADFMRYPDEHVTLIMLSNKAHFNFNDLNFEIAQMIFDSSFIPDIPVSDNENNRNFTQQLIDLAATDGLEKVKDLLEKERQSRQPIEFLLRFKGFDYLDEGQPEKAITIFELNVKAHPKSAKALQGLAEGYMETGKNDLALKYFKLSSQLNPENPFVQNMIKKLK